MQFFSMSEGILGIILGAFLGGGLQLITTIIQRRHEARTMRVALACEVDATCRLIRFQKYEEGILSLLKSVETSPDQVTTVILDARSDYFTVFTAMAARLGILGSAEVADLVRFHSYCKSAIDSVRMDGPFSGDVASEDSRANLENLLDLVRTILSLVD